MKDVVMIDYLIDLVEKEIERIEKNGEEWEDMEFERSVELEFRKYVVEKLIDMLEEVE